VERCERISYGQKGVFSGAKKVWLIWDLFFGEGFNGKYLAANSAEEFNKTPHPQKPHLKLATQWFLIWRGRKQAPAACLRPLNILPNERRSASRKAERRELILTTKKGGKKGLSWNRN